MKKLSILFTAVGLLAMTGCKDAGKTEEAPEHKVDSTTTVAHETPAPEAPMDSAAIAKAWENYMTPGDMHKWMASTDGSWKGEMTSWMGPDAPPSPVSIVFAENKMVLGNRYQESVYKGKMMVWISKVMA